MSEPSEWIKLIAAADCPPGQARYVEAGGRDLAVFHLTEPDRFFVTDNSCPHAGGNLSAGRIEAGVVTCPWHQWQFELHGGQCTTAPNVRLRAYETRIENGLVLARITA